MTIPTERPTERPTEQPLQLPNEPFYEPRRSTDPRARWGMILILIGAVWLIFSLATSSGLPQAIDATAERPIAPQRFAVERVVFVGANDRLTVERGSDEVELSGTIFQSNLLGSIDGALDEVRVETSVEDGVLTINVRRPVGITQSSSEIVLEVPEGIDLDLRNLNGAIVLDQLEASGRVESVNGFISVLGGSGDLDLHNTNGSIEVSEFQGNLTLNAVNGPITVRDSAGGDISAEAVNGEIFIEGAQGLLMATSINGPIFLRELLGATVQVETTSGDIELSGILAAAAHTMTTITGNVEIEFDAPPSGRFEVTTLNGDIEINLPHEPTSFERRRVSGTWLGGEAGTLRISTTSGDVEIGE